MREIESAVADERETDSIGNVDRDYGLPIVNLDRFDDLDCRVRNRHGMEHLLGYVRQT